MARMKALRLSAPSEGGTPTLALENVPRPTPGPNEALVKIIATGISPSDILNSKGGFPDTTYPRIPGRDYAGIVESGPDHLVGKAVFGTSGDSLGFTADGVHAEYAIVPADALTPKPEGLSFAQAAAVPLTFTVGVLALNRARLAKGETAMVIGASGNVGGAAVQIAKQMGAKVLTAARRDWADVNTASDPEFKKAMELTGGKGVDVIFETTGSPQLMHAALGVLAQGGRLPFIAAPRTGSRDFTFDMKDLYRNDNSIVGVNSLNVSIQGTATDLAKMTTAFDKGDLKAPEDSSFEIIGIDQAVDAYKSGSKKKFIIQFPQ